MAPGSLTIPEDILYGRIDPRHKPSSTEPQAWERRMRLDEHLVWHFGPERPKIDEPVRVFGKQGHPLTLLEENDEDQLFATYGILAVYVPGSQRMDGKNAGIELKNGDIVHVRGHLLQKLMQIEQGDKVRSGDGIGILEDVVSAGKYDLTYIVRLENRPDEVREYHRDQLLHY